MPATASLNKRTIIKQTQQIKSKFALSMHVTHILRCHLAYNGKLASNANAELNSGYEKHKNRKDIAQCIMIFPDEYLVVGRRWCHRGRCRYWRRNAHFTVAADECIYYYMLAVSTQDAIAAHRFIQLLHYIVCPIERHMWSYVSMRLHQPNARVVFIFIHVIIITIIVITRPNE